MKTRKTFFSLLAVALLGLFAWAWLAPAGPGNSPDISLVTVDGERLSLADFRGRPILLAFWATTCRVCLREMPHLIELYNELSPQGLEIIAIAMRHDKPSHVLSMRKARSIPYPVAMDIDGAAARAFGNVRLTPTSFLIAPDGRIVLRRTGALDMVKLRKNIHNMLQQAGTSRLFAADES